MLYKNKICPECKRTFTPRTYVQDYCRKSHGINGREKAFRKRNGMFRQKYRNLKRKLGGNEGLLVYLKKRKKDIDKSIEFVESGGMRIKSDKGWNWKVNRKQNEQKT